MAEGDTVKIRMRNDVDTPTVYGFWEYDLFPFCVGGKLSLPVVGRPGYWYWCNAGTTVNPFVTMTLQDGDAAQRRLEALKADYSGAMAALERQFTVRAAAVVPGLASSAAAANILNKLTR